MESGTLGLLRQNYHETLRRSFIDDLILQRRTHLLQKSDDQSNTLVNPRALDQKTREFLDSCSNLPNSFCDSLILLKQLRESVFDFGEEAPAYILKHHSAQLASSLRKLFEQASWRDHEDLVSFCVLLAETDLDMYIQSKSREGDGLDHSIRTEEQIRFGSQDKLLVPSLVSFLGKLLGENNQGRRPPFAEIALPAKDCLSCLSFLTQFDPQVGRLFLDDIQMYKAVLDLTSDHPEDLKLDLVAFIYSLMRTVREDFVQQITSIELKLMVSVISDQTLTPSDIETALHLIRDVLNPKQFEDEIPFIKMASFLLDVGMEDSLTRILSWRNEGMDEEATPGDVLLNKCLVLRILAHLTSYKDYRECKDPVELLTPRICERLVTICMDEAHSVVLASDGIMCLSNIAMSSNEPTLRFLTHNKEFWNWAVFEMHSSCNSDHVGRITKLLIILELCEIPLKSASKFERFGGWQDFADICLRAATILEEVGSPLMMRPLQLLCCTQEYDELSTAKLRHNQLDLLQHFALYESDSQHDFQDQENTRDYLATMAQRVLELDQHRDTFF